MQRHGVTWICPFDLAYLMLFYLSTGISDAILSLISLISFYLNLGCFTFGCLLM